MVINVGNHYLHNGKEVTCTAKHASGQWFTYHFSDGWSFTGDPKGMLTNGTLTDLPPPAKAVDTATDPNWKRAKAVPAIVPMPDFLKNELEKDSNG